MIGSSLVGWYVAQAAFWILIVIAFWRRELSATAIGVFVVLWVGAFFCLRAYLYGGPFTVFVALLDIGLVLAIFKGDVKLF